jgi:hypothetical protein
MFLQEHFSMMRSANAIEGVFLQEHFFTFACTSAYWLRASCFDPPSLALPEIATTEAPTPPGSRQAGKRRNTVAHSKN